MVPIRECGASVPVPGFRRRGRSSLLLSSPLLPASLNSVHKLIFKILQRFHRLPVARLNSIVIAGFRVWFNLVSCIGSPPHHAFCLSSTHCTRVLALGTPGNPTATSTGTLHLSLTTALSMRRRLTSTLSFFALLSWGMPQFVVNHGPGYFVRGPGPLPRAAREGAGKNLPLQTSYRAPNMGLGC